MKWQTGMMPDQTVKLLGLTKSSVQAERAERKIEDRKTASFFFFVKGAAFFVKLPYI